MDVPRPHEPTRRDAPGRRDLDLLVWDAPNIDMTLSTILGARPASSDRPRFDAIARWFLAEAGARVVINYRNKEKRAQQLVSKIEEAGGSALAIGADLTDPASVASMIETVTTEFGGLDLLVLNASGGMESQFGEDYALKLNRDAQAALADAALERMGAGGQIVFVTSHQAHFIDEVATMDSYEPVARSKRAGEDALRERIPAFAEKGVGFVVVSGDMIEGTITATLLERANPGAIAERRESAGKLYNVSEFAAEVAKAAVDPVPADNTRLVGDVRAFAAGQPVRVVEP